ncbi:MAG: ABC transporter permease, partial [Acidobacteriota bacterium]
MGDHAPCRPPVMSRTLLGWISRALLDPGAREAMLGDLEEDYRQRASYNRARAGWLYRREALRSVGALCRRPARRSGSLSRKHSAASLVRGRGDSLMQAFFDDLRLAGRNLRRAPGFSLVVVLTLALGIGSVTAVYTLIDGVVLRPLPFEDPDSLVRLYGFNTETGAGQWTSSYPDYADIRDRSKSFSLLAAANAFPDNVTGHSDRPARITVGHVTHDFFDLLGTRVVLGRELLPEDDRQGAEPVVVLSESFWRRHFAGQENVLDRRLTINAVVHTIVGVVETPHVPQDAEIFTALAAQAGTEVRGVHNIQPIGRLAAGATIHSANAELATIAAQLAEEYPGENLTRGARLVPLHEALVGPLRQPFFLLLGAAAFVLLIVCANVSNLLLHRAAGRSREVATRSALGANAPQLLRQFFAESFWLVGLGGALGFAFAWLGKEIQLQNIPTTLPRADQVALDERILLFGFALTAIIAVVFSLVPVLEVSRRDLFAALGAGTRHQGETRSRGRLRRGLVVAEIALAVILVIGASLMIRTMRQLADVDPGCDPESVLAIPLELQVPFISPEWPQTLSFF